MNKEYCPECDKELSNWFRFYLDEAKHSIHSNFEIFLKKTKGVEGS